MWTLVILINFSGLKYTEAEECNWRSGNSKIGCNIEISPLPGFCSVKFILSNLSQFCGEENMKAVVQINGVPMCHFKRQKLICKFT